MEPMETDSAKKQPIYTSRLWRIKLGLRAFDIICLAIITAMGISILNQWNEIGHGIFFAAAFVGPLIATFIWDIAEALSIYRRAGRRGVYPGVVIILDLLMGLGWVVLVYFAVRIWTEPSLKAFWDNISRIAASDDPPEVVEAVAKVVYNRLVHMGRVFIAFSVFVTLHHWILFFIGCYEAHDRQERIKEIAARVEQLPRPRSYGGATAAQVICGERR